MKKRYFHSVLYTLFFCILKKVEKFGLKGFIKKLQNKRLVCFDNHLQGDGIKLYKKYYFHYDFLCKKCYFHYDLHVKKCHFHYDMQKMIFFVQESVLMSEEDN
jgi:hypothetical protein